MHNKITDTKPIEITKLLTEHRWDLVLLLIPHMLWDHWKGKQVSAFTTTLNKLYDQSLSLRTNPITEVHFFQYII